MDIENQYLLLGKSNVFLFIVWFSCEWNHMHVHIYLHIYCVFEHNISCISICVKLKGIVYLIRLYFQIAKIFLSKLFLVEKCM